MHGSPPTASSTALAASLRSRCGAAFIRCRTRAQVMALVCIALGRRYPFCFSGITAAVMMVICLTIYTPRFQGNDDVQMAMIAAGQGICLAPDEHLIFSNIVLGKALSQLYSACPVVPWYGLHLYLLQFLANATFIYCAVLLSTPRRALATALTAGVSR